LPPLNITRGGASASWLLRAEANSEVGARLGKAVMRRKPGVVKSMLLR
jgi:hypothetical protein